MHAWLRVSLCAASVSSPSSSCSSDRACLVEVDAECGPAPTTEGKKDDRETTCTQEIHSSQLRERAAVCLLCSVGPVAHLVSRRHSPSDAVRAVAETSATDGNASERQEQQLRAADHLPQIERHRAVGRGAREKRSVERAGSREVGEYERRRSGSRDTLSVCAPVCSCRVLPCVGPAAGSSERASERPGGLRLCSCPPVVGRLNRFPTRVSSATGTRCGCG